MRVKRILLGFSNVANSHLFFSLCFWFVSKRASCGMCMCVSFLSRIVGNEMCIIFHARSLKRNANNWYKANANELSISNGNMKERIEREKNRSKQ